MSAAESGDSVPLSPDGVAGERAATAAHRARSIQSRVSNVLALGLMSALGIGALTWYYAHAIARQDQMRRNAQLASARRGDGDLPLPSLGRIDAPPLAVPADAGPSGAPPELAPQFLTEVPPTREPLRAPLVAAPAGIAGNGYGVGAAPPAKTPAQLDLERQLSGTAFAAPGANLPTGGGQDSGNGDAAPFADAREPARPDLPGPGAGRLSELLRPSLTAPVRAQILPTMRLLLPKGAFIDCTLETAIDSTLPGMTTCVTATDTFGVDGEVVLLERGTKLVGEVRGEVQQGAARIFVLWTEARTPTGVIIPLASPGADELGRAGLAGAVERHFWQRFGAAMLVTVIDGAVQAAVQAGNRGDGTVIYNPSAGEGVMTEVLKNTINIPPTITKTQGDRVQVLVARDLDFRGVYALRPIPATR
jgi:type IV secretion system protein VirB10